jgi:hypothetical protein
MEMRSPFASDDRKGWSNRDGASFTASIDVTLNSQGSIGSIDGNRSRKEHARLIERPWRGGFYERWLPSHGDRIAVLV